MRLRWALGIGMLAIAGTIGIHELKATPQMLGSPCVVVVPRDWGEFKGLSKSGLVFEDKAGTLRLLDQMPCNMADGNSVPQVSVEVRRR
ncbi:MAG: hypothetical protein LAN64_00060 [Acidobacteriia bacterium]|nr:hypothetical protein [Terriglobia bacterium]